MTRLVSLAFGLIAVPACMAGDRALTGMCPNNEVCSPATPDGLDFDGASIVGEPLASGPAPTAIGGTQQIELYDDATDAPLAVPFTVNDDGAQGVRFEQQNGNVVTVRGVGASGNYLIIYDATDDGVLDQKLLDGAQIDTIALVSATTFEVVPSGMPIVYLPGVTDVGIALSGQVQGAEARLIDTSMTATLAGATATQPAWDTLELGSASPGDFALTVTAGDVASTQLTVSVVAGPDTLALAPQTPGQPLCFAATNNGRFVSGLEWTFTLNGVADQELGNCMELTDDPAGEPVTIVASAGGLTTTVETTVTAHAAHRVTRYRLAAGERAAMQAATAF